MKKAKSGLTINKLLKGVPKSLKIVFNKDSSFSWSHTGDLKTNETLAILERLKFELLSWELKHQKAQ